MNRHLATLIAVSLFAATAASGASVREASAAKFDEHLQSALALEPIAVSVIVTTHGEPRAGAEAARALGGVVTWEYDIIDGFAATVPTSALSEIAAREDVARVHLDRPVAPLMDVSHKAVEADKAWASGYKGAGITVAVIDTGIDVLHPFFTGAIVACVSTIGGVVSPECTDSDGHGTHVAGTVASRSTEYPGIAPEASLAVVRVLHALGAGLSSDIIAGMEWVRDNQNAVSPPIRVATMSIGYIDPGCGDDSNPEAQAANNLVSSGVTFTVAAGNSGHDTCTIDGASAASKVITIGAVDDKNTEVQTDDVIADFSSGGPTSDGRLKPDVALPGVAIVSAYLGGITASLSGTSMATPHAAGIAALILDKEPALTTDQVKDRILSTAIKTEHTGSQPNNVYGHGLGNACRALQLTTCREVAPPPEPTHVHVASVSLSFTHQGRNGHKVTVEAKIVDAGGAAVSGASVSFSVTSPEGDVYTGSGTTDTAGVASYTARQNGGGHGTWEGCVTDVSGTNLVYDPAANVETCDTIPVT